MKFLIAARKMLFRFLLGTVLAMPSAPILAGNGLSDLGFGARSHGLAGADLAVTNDTAAINVNPAGLAEINASAFDFYLEPFYIGSRHTDGLGNNSTLAAPISSVLGGGYARRLPGTRIVVGAGLFAQGGSGFAHENLATPFGTRDDVSSSFGAVKLEPGLAWQATDQLNVGVALGINYSQAKQKFLPNTSFVDPSGVAPPFFGFRVDSLDGISLNGKVGFRYQLDPEWTIAGAYTSKTKIKLEKGRATFDYDAAGFGQVNYRSATQTGLALPQEAGIGAAYRPTGTWLVTAEVNWVDWSSALKSSTLTVSNPDNASVPQSLSFTSRLDWRDQYVIAVGAEHRWSDVTTLRFGVNYGRNPVPERTLSLTLPAIAETSIAAGFSRRISGQWEFSGSAIYQLPVKVRYSNPDSPFGPGSTESWEAVLLNFTISRRW